MGPDAYSTRTTRAALGFLLLLSASCSTTYAVQLNVENCQTFPAPESGPAPTQGAAPPTLGAATPKRGTSARIGPTGARFGPSEPHRGHGAEFMTQAASAESDGSVANPAPESGPAVPGSGPTEPGSGPAPQAPGSGPKAPSDYESDGPPPLVSDSASSADDDGDTSSWHYARDPSDSDTESDGPPPLISGSDDSDADDGDASESYRDAAYHDFYDQTTGAWIYYVQKDGRPSPGSTYDGSGRPHQSVYGRSDDFNPYPFTYRSDDFNPYPFTYPRKSNYEAWWQNNRVRAPPPHSDMDFVEYGCRRLRESASAHRITQGGSGWPVFSLLGTFNNVVVGNDITIV